MSQRWEVEITVWNNDAYAPKQRMCYTVPFAIKLDATDQCYYLIEDREGIFIDADMNIHLIGASQAGAVYHLGHTRKVTEIKLDAEDELAIGSSRVMILRLYDGKQGTVRPPRSSDKGSICRICHDAASEAEPLLSLCRCKGDTQWVHLSCLREWIRSPEPLKANFRALKLLQRALMCEICRTLYVSNPAVYLPELFADEYSALPIALVRVTSKKATPAHYLVNLRSYAIIGSSAAADIFIKDFLVSPMHCQLEYHDGIVLVKDLGVTTGTFLSCRSSMRLSTTACTTIRFKNTTLEIRPRRIASLSY